eukprot:11474690-Alexandrium_andersonii.AAC.1
MGGWSAWAGGATQQTPDPLQDPWAGASWGQGWADSSSVQGRPREYSVDVRMWSDARSCTSRPSPRATASGSPRRAVTCWGSSHRAAA